MISEERTALEYFAGGVPTGEYFGMTLQDLREISASDHSDDRRVSRLQELCFVGLFSYFEAFCKDQFAALINVEPSLVENLKAAGQDILIDARHVAAYGADAYSRLGFVLAAKPTSEFGTAQKINSNYRALLNISPFSKDEQREFERLLADRHLLVHHGGVMTLSYLEQRRGLGTKQRKEAFFDSRVIGREEVAEAIDFVEGIARKLCQSTYAALVGYLESRGVQYSGERAKALRYIGHWWRDEAA